MQTKEILAAFKTELKLEDELRSMIFDFEKSNTAVEIIKTYNKIKAVLSACANEDKQVNIYVLNGLLGEIKLNVEVFQCGLGSARLERQLSKKLAV